MSIFFGRTMLFLSIGIVVLFIVLNPYTVLGPLAYFLLPLLVYPFLNRLRLLQSDMVLSLLCLVAISLVGVVSSFIHNIGQFIHLKVSISIIMYVFIAYAIFMIFEKRDLGFDSLVLIVFSIVVLNSIVIVFQVLYPSFRAWVESFLIPSGNIDWKEGFRYRGLASGGGASLSVLVATSVVLALYLYSEKKIGVLFLCCSVFILLLSLFFVGRTGFLLLPIIIAFFILFNFRKYFARVLATSLVVVFCVFIFGDQIKSFLIDQYGVGFYNYSFGFFLGGVEGIKKEGTVGIIIEFLQVVPSTFPEVLIGYGFYGGSDFEPWTDSGYSRMFLSVGYFFGIAFYLVFFLMFRNALFKKKFLFLTMGGVLLIAELKEPLLFTGYASRVYVLLLAYVFFEHSYKKRKWHRLSQPI